jgi:hypothetical protein
MAGSDVSSPFEDVALASRYEKWYVGKGRRADTLEKALLEKLLGSLPVTDRSYDLTALITTLEFLPDPASFQAADALGDVVMTVAISNCCPMPATDQNDR